jgi:polar amino acid transport system permease protein
VDFSFVLNEWRVLLIGTYNTILVSAVSLILGFLLGLLVCLARLSSHLFLAGIGQLYISFFRGVPLLVQLLLIFYMLPLIGVNISSMGAAVVGVTVVAAAYQAEILRGGFQAIPRGHIEAARMMGLPAWRIFVRIQLPQALQRVMPSLVNDAILLLKSSSLISVVGVLDLTRASQNIAASSLRPMESYLAAAIIYLILTALLSIAGRMLEHRMALAGGLAR